MTTRVQWVVSTRNVNERLDKVLAAKRADWSRSQIQTWILKQYVTVNDQKVKSNYRLKENDVICVEVPKKKPFTLKAEKLPLDILYEDEAILVLNKERGIVVHPAESHPTKTIANALYYYYDLTAVNGLLRQGIVHRLDKDTSGILLVAKTKEASDHLQDQFKKRSVERLYKAIVHGQLAHQTGTIEAPIGRNVKERTKMAVTSQNSKYAKTTFKTLAVYDDCSFVQCQLHTGRMHQIRVHMDYIGHPLVGDPLYGYKKGHPLIEGQALHASEICFNHPVTNEKMRFAAPLPADMEGILRANCAM